MIRKISVNSKNVGLENSDKILNPNHENENVYVQKFLHRESDHVNENGYENESRRARHRENERD